MALAKIGKLVSETKYRLGQEGLDAIPSLQSFVKVEAEEQLYHLEANLLLLKLYQVHPEQRQNDLIALILALSLMQFPANDFQLCVYLIPQPLHGEGPFPSLFRVAELLRTARFHLVWEELDKISSLLSSVSGFYDSIRKYISNQIVITYETIEKNTLQSFLKLDGDAFDAYVAKHGWKKSLEHVQFNRSSSEESASDPSSQSDAVYESAIQSRVVKWPFTSRYLK
mmetsp:Transcript_1940/g.2623  ORF Transcript_1940/g.2623 Transcript_1940/m.2623 type:complete len:226 (-) Transcript_1940:23-700(-)